MLWQKGWQETRFRLIFAVIYIGLFLVQPISLGMKTPDGGKAIVFAVWVCVAVISLLLAGAGIATQRSIPGAKGHSSTLFTLSLPVSRIRLLAVRAGLGWLEMAGVIAVTCAALWLFAPTLRDAAPAEMARHALVLIICGSALYCIPVLLGTFLEDQWRLGGSIIAYIVLWWVLSHAPGLASVNIFQAMSTGSPLFTHAMPWMAMAFSAELAAILLFAAWKVAQIREY